MKPTIFHLLLLVFALSFYLSTKIKKISEFVQDVGNIF